MPDLTSRKSETDADRRRNEHQFAALAKGLASVDNMGERERQIFDQIAASRPSSNGPRHRAASDIFDRPPLTPPFEAMRQLGERMARERDEKVFQYAFGSSPLDDWDNVTASTMLGDEVYPPHVNCRCEEPEPPKPPADKVIDAPFRVLEDAGDKFRQNPMPLVEQMPPRILPDKYRGGDPTA